MRQQISNIEIKEIQDQKQNPLHLMLGISRVQMSDDDLVGGEWEQ